MTGQENERGAPLYLYEKGERSMNYDPELAALLSQPWSEGACRGYVISAMERCGFKPADIQQVMMELHEIFDYTTLEEARAYYERSLYPYCFQREVFYAGTGQIRKRVQNCRSW